MTFLTSMIIGAVVGVASSGHGLLVTIALATVAGIAHMVGVSSGRNK